MAAIATANPSFRDLIVGNEPNLNRFWLPQFNLDGTGASAPAYLSLLATTYDAVKAAAPEARIWGGALAPRGVDRPGTGRDTISPTRFVRELGQAYRASGRYKPVMDGFAFHPYAENSSVPVDRAPADPDHLGLADQDKLVRLLGQAFDGTEQVGSGLPILYDEYGIESVVNPEKAALYSGTEPVDDRPVEEPAQAVAYAQALRMAYCQSNVAGVLLFHSADESALAGWQSGLFYPDGTPKSSLGIVRDTLDAIANGTIRKCPLDPKPVVAFTSAIRKISLRCERDCVYRARLLRLPAGSVTAWRNGRSAAGKRLSFQLAPRVSPGAVPAHDLVRARDEARQGRRPLQRAVYGALAPRGADARRLRRQRREHDRAEAEGLARRGGRRHRPRAGPGARPAARRRLRRGRDHELLAAGARRSAPPASSPSSGTWPTGPGTCGSSCRCTSRARRRRR